MSTLDSASVTMKHGRMMSHTGRATGSRWQPNRRRTGLPLRVAVYDEIGRAIRSGELRSGEPLPREGDLCESFDVSRTVMREALILLEEDGLIRTRRGIGRFVADELPALGLERLRPIEELIASPGDVTVRRLQSRVEDETDFTQRLASPQVYLSECVVDGASGPIALVQEWVHLEWLRQRMPGVIDSDDAKSTVLSMILEHRRPSISRATCLIAASNAGAERSRLFGAKPRDAVLILTQTLEAETGPFYLSKTLLGASANHLAINQIIQ